MSTNKKVQTKAEMLLNTNKSVKERSVKYTNRIKTTLHTKIITKLEEEIEAIDDKIFELEDFSLDTDKNAGQYKLTKEECQKRFEEMIDLEWEKTLKEAELKAKKETFINLFGKL